ncbi:MAG: amidohydrolase family protein, partial [Anaerovoracaceae bacterium]
MARKIVAGIMVGLLALSVSGCGEKKTEGLLIKNANIYTVDEKGTVAEAMVAKGNEIVYVGDEKGAEEFTTKKMEVVDAKGGTVMPGVVDSHMHPAKSATAYLFEIGLADLVGEEAYVKEIKKFIEENPEAEAYVGSGYMRSAWDDVGPRKEVLDKLCSDKPMIITSVDGHSVWVNSFALEKAGVTKDTADPEGGVIKRDPVTGEPSGLLQESAMALVEDQKPIYTKEQYKEGILWLQEWFNQVGLTTMFDAMIPIDNEDYYMAYQELASEGKLTMRIRGAWHMSPEMAKDMAGYEAMVDKAVEQSKKFDTAYFQVNTFKFFADQVIEEESGYLSQPYSNRTDGWTGIKVWDDEV